MPFVFDPLLDDQEKKKQEDQQSQGAPEMTGGGETFSGSSQAQQPQQKGTAKQGSGFVNLDSYLSANQGNNFGQQFTGKVKGDVDQAKQTFNDTSNQFTDASEKGTTRWNNIQDPVKGIVDNAGSGTSQADVDKFKGYAGSSYQGPESFTGSTYGTQVQGATRKAAQEANNLQSEGGRFALLDQFFGRPTYNQGQKSLDNLLVQRDPGVAARSNNLSNQSKQLLSQTGQQATELDNLATSNRFATDDAAKQTQDYLANSKAGFQSDLDTRFSDYNKGNDAYNQALQADVGDDDLSADTLAAYGLHSGDNLYTANLSDYLKAPEKASLGQFASDQDYAKYLALSQLSGEDPTYLSADDRGQAGSAAGMGRETVDKAALGQSIADTKNAYSAELSDYINKYPALKSAQDILATQGMSQAVERTPEQYQQIRDWLDQQIAPFKESLDSKYHVDRVVNQRTPSPAGFGPKRPLSIQPTAPRGFGFPGRAR